MSGISGYDFLMKILLLIIIVSLSSLTFAQNPKQDQKAREQLLDYMLDNYEVLQGQDVEGFLTHCPLMQNTTGANQAYCQSVYNNQKNLFDEMAERLSDVRNETVSQEQTLGVISCLPVAPPVFNDLEDILRRLDSEDQCSPMASGDFKVSKFLLTRKPDGNYDAVVNIDFQQVNGSVSPAEMKTRINNCLVGFTPHLRSPTGETLNIRVMTPAEIETTYPISHRPPAAVVKLHQGIVTNPDGSTGQFRADAANYPDNIACDVILHETLHHLGLCDEYAESSSAILPSQPPGSTKTFADAFSCRTVPTQNTVMGEHYRAIPLVVPKKYSCQCTSDACRNSLRGTDSESRDIQAMLMKSDAQSVLPSAVLSFCRDEYLNPNLHPMKEPGKRSVLVSNNEYSVTFENRSLNPFPGAGGSAPRFNVTRRLITCNCNGNAECISGIPEAVEHVRNNPSARGCPLDTEALPQTSMTPPTGESSRIEGDIIHIVSTPESTDSLLLPNHFNRILYGNCMTGPTANYNQCASFAYSGTGDAYCSDKPASCSSDSFFLGGAPQ